MLIRPAAIAVSVAITVFGAFACGSSDDGGKVATGGSGGVVSGGGSGGIAQGGMAGFLTGGFAGVSSGGVAGAFNFGPYPPGPYGHDVDLTIADLAWEGYVNETGAVSSDQMPYVDYGTDAMRKSGKAYGLIHVSADT